MIAALALLAPFAASTASSLTADLPGGQGDLKLRFDRGEIQESGLALVQGNVHGTIRFRARDGQRRAPMKVWADRMDAVLNRPAGSDRKELESFTARGNVRVETGDIRGTCARAELSMAGQTLELSGSDQSPVHARRGGLAFEGPRFVIKLDQRTLHGDGPLTARLALKGRKETATLEAAGGADVLAPSGRRPGLCRLHGPVRYRDGELVIRAQALEAYLAPRRRREAEAKASAGELEVTRILAPAAPHADGQAPPGVEIIAGGHSLRCRSATYDVAARLAELSGGVRVSAARAGAAAGAPATLSAPAIYAHRDEDGAWTLRAKGGVFHVVLARKGPRGTGGTN